MDVAQSTTMQTLISFALNWELRREQGFMVLRVKTIPTHFPPNNLYTPIGQLRLVNVISYGYRLALVQFSNP